MKTQHTINTNQMFWDPSTGLIRTCAPFLSLKSAAAELTKYLFRVLQLLKWENKVKDYDLYRDTTSISFHVSTEK